MEMCDRLYSKIYLRDLISAAVRLNLIGPLDGVLLQVEIFPVLDNLLQQTLYPSQETDERSCANSCYEGSADIVCVQKGSAAPTVEAAPIILDGRCAAIQFYNRIKPVQTAPVVDLLQSRHDMLYSRLFNS